MGTDSGGGRVRDDVLVVSGGGFPDRTYVAVDTLLSVAAELESDGQYGRYDNRDVAALLRKLASAVLGVDQELVGKVEANLERWEASNDE